MAERITNARLSLVHGEAFFEHLHRHPAPPSNAFWLAADYGYIFRQLRGGPGVPRFALPWRVGQQNTFWSAYCGQTPVSQISADQALRSLIPLRLVPLGRPKISVHGGAERVHYDIFGFPHGIVCALTLQTGTRASMTIDAWRDRWRSLRSGAGYTFEAPGEHPRVDLRASDVLKALVDWHRREFYGVGQSATGSEDPFSVAAVIKGEGVDPRVPIASQPQLQRSLNAVSAWPVSWKTCTVPDLADAALPVRNKNVAPGDVLYAGRRGRVIWRPMLFVHRSTATDRLHALGCLAHNMVAATVQAESLRLLAVALGGMQPSERGRIPSILRQRAAIQLGRMWRGDLTYRSSSVKRLLEDPSSLAQVNQLLLEEGVATLTP